jgi:hypothetical protein
LRNCIILPFNWSDALKAAHLDFTAFKSRTVASASRDALKDDIKIIAQAAAANAEYIVTDDADTLAKYAGELKANGKIDCGCILLSGEFDRAYFARGQRDFTDQLDERGEEE